MNWKELKTISETVKLTVENVNTNKNVTEKLIIITNMFAWLKENGQCVLIDTKKKRLKTQDNYIETYIYKWGGKFQIIKIYKYNKIVDCRMKIL